MTIENSSDQGIRVRGSDDPNRGIRVRGSDDPNHGIRVRGSDDPNHGIRVRGSDIPTFRPNEVIPGDVYKSWIREQAPRFAADIGSRTPWTEPQAQYRDTNYQRISRYKQRDFMRGTDFIVPRPNRFERQLNRLENNNQPATLRGLLDGTEARLVRRPRRNAQVVAGNNDGLWRNMIDRVNARGNRGQAGGR